MPKKRDVSDCSILLVDDESSNLRFLQMLLNGVGYKHLLTAESGSDAIEICAASKPDLVLLDLHMPAIDGYAVLDALRADASGGVYLPILVFTADATRTARERALSLGASDFLTKPGDAMEITLRVRNFLTLRVLQQQLSDRGDELEDKVRERTQELELAQMEILERLAKACEYRDDDTGEHTRRVGEMSASIARELGLPPRDVELIRLASRLHDVGKIAIPDSVLLKPGKLTKFELASMQTHAQVGSDILTNSSAPLLQMAERIALTHHERFDGTGYPNGLAGDMIPIEGRIVAVADVFDALTHARPYKEPWPVGAACDEIRAGSGSHFDPGVVNAFLCLLIRRGQIDRAA